MADKFCTKIENTNPTLISKVPLDTPEYAAFCIMDIIGYDTLLPALDKYGCDGVWSYLMVLAQDFIGSEYDCPSRSFYDCLVEYVKETVL